MGGRLGGLLADRLQSKVGGKAPFFISSALFLLWIVAACMDAIIASARYFINKPYIREIAKEKIVEVEKTVEPKPRRKALEKPSKPRIPVEPKMPIVSPEDDFPDFKTPSTVLLKDRSGERREIQKSENDRNIRIIRETLADHHVRVATIKGLAADVSVALKADSVMASILKDCVGLDVTG